MDPGRHVSTHPYHDLQIPKDAPFKLQPAPRKGWGMFATTNIPRGAIILTEKPLFVIRKPHWMIYEGDVRTALNKASKRAQHQFLCIRDDVNSTFPCFSDAFAENSFAIADSDASCKTKVHGCFVLHSRINHSCLPNSKIPDTHPVGSITSYATRDIAAGEEITFCYDSSFGCRTRSERYELLRFECTCKACELGTEFQVLSDMRRVLARGLSYLTVGHDLDGQQHVAGAAIIVDAKLKRAAETFRIPLSSRLVYNLLIMALAEQEGELDAFLVERMRPGISILPPLFDTESNREIARTAMAKTTWTQKFCVSLALWGKEDAGDEAAIKVFRLLRGVRE